MRISFRLSSVVSLLYPYQTTVCPDLPIISSSSVKSKYQLNIFTKIGFPLSISLVIVKNSSSSSKISPEVEFSYHLSCANWIHAGIFSAIVEPVAYTLS